jgi:DNA-binding XRE family transcriptional regulator
MEYEVELTPSDIGEIVSVIRIQWLKMHSQPFAEKIGVSEKVLINVEDGKGPHGMLLLRKINKTFNRIEISLSVKLIN